MTPFAKLFDSTELGQIVAVFDVWGKSPTLDFTVQSSSGRLINLTIHFDDEDIEEAKNMFQGLDTDSAISLIRQGVPEESFGHLTLH